MLSLFTSCSGDKLTEDRDKALPHRSTTIFANLGFTERPSAIICFTWMENATIEVSDLRMGSELCVLKVQFYNSKVNERWLHGWCGRIDDFRHDALFKYYLKNQINLQLIFF